MQALAERGHRVRVVTRVERFGAEGQQQLAGELRARGVDFRTAGNSIAFELHGVDVRALTLDSHLRAFFSSHVDEFDPDIVITSTDDPAQLMFDLAIRLPRARVMYLVRATIAVPFGPESSSISDERTRRLRQADGVVGVSQYVADYCRKYGDLDAVHVPISLLDPGRPGLLGRFYNRYVTIVNPCAVKGIDIMLGLADRMPDVPFAAVPTWGTTSRDLVELRRRPNVTVIPPVDHIDDLLRTTRVMLVPSVWAEARSRMILESMARGIPVMASDVGGIHEAMMGVDYLLPVNQVNGYRPNVDEHMVPVANVPEQNIEPWATVLRRLTTDEPHWRELSVRSTQAALDYMAHLSVAPFEARLEAMLQQPKKGAAADIRRNPIENLSEAKKKLLAMRLQQRSRESKRLENLWFPLAAETSPDLPRLFCFPYAGGGALHYRGWQPELPDIAISPVRLPARESRLTEPPVERMESLIRTLASEIEPFLNAPFAFFGHSMGAIIAFELARELRRRGKPLPAGLIASAARAPQFRLGYVPSPEPGDSEFLDQIQRLEGLPEDVLANEELRRLALPALRSDARLYTRYVYQPDLPLNIPIVTYGGQSDPNVSAVHMDAWREQTTAAFDVRQFPGGHFFIHSARDAFLAALAGDLRRIMRGAHVR